MSRDPPQTLAMPFYERPEHGTLVIAALLILALSFAGDWILTYVHPGANPWHLLPWFGLAAAVIVIVGIATSLLPRRTRKEK